MYCTGWSQKNASVLKICRLTIVICFEHGVTIYKAEFLYHHFGRAVYKTKKRDPEEHLLSITHTTDTRHLGERNNVISDVSFWRFIRRAVTGSRIGTFVKKIHLIFCKTLIFFFCYNIFVTEAFFNLCTLCIIVV